jgi:nucleotide-binding universal stress UspA family protein
LPARERTAEAIQDAPSFGALAERDRAYRRSLAAADLVAATGGQLHMVHVVREPAEEWGLPVEALMPFRSRRATRVLSDHAADVELHNVDIAERHLVEGSPVDGILDTAHRIGAALIVAGSRAPGRHAPFLGSVAEGLVHHSPVALLVLRGAASWRPDHVVVGDDGSDGARTAGRLGAVVAQVTHVPMLLVRALPDLAVLGERTQALSQEQVAHVRATIEESLTTRASSLAGACVSTSRRVVVDDPADALVAAACEGSRPALIAVGRRGLGRAERLRLGSVSLSVLHRAPGAVLIAPAHHEGPWS